MLQEIHMRSEANFDDLYSYELLYILWNQKRLVISFRQEKANRFYLYKQRKWKIRAIKNFFIEIEKGMDSELLSHWTFWLITLPATAFYHLD